MTPGGGRRRQRLRRVSCGVEGGMVLPVVGRPGLSLRVHPLRWQEPRVMVLSDDDVPPVLVHGSVVLSAEQNQVAGNP